VEIWTVERVRNRRDLRLIGKKASDFVREVEVALSSTPGLESLSNGAGGPDAPPTRLRALPIAGERLLSVFQIRQRMTVFVHTAGVDTRRVKVKNGGSGL
jgi:hypothetical protein